MNYCYLLTFLCIFLRLVINSNGSKFKKCNDNVFCKRYFNYVNFLNNEYNKSLKSGNEIKKYIWSVNPKSVLFFENCDEGKLNKDICSTISFELYNTYHKEIPPLKCQVFIYNIGILRIKIDETESISGFKRFKVDQEVIFQDDQVSEFLIKKEDSSIGIDLNNKLIKFNVLNLNDIFFYNYKISRCEYRIEINFEPFNIETHMCNKKISTINGKQFFNFERSGRVYPKIRFHRIYSNNNHLLSTSIKNLYSRSKVRNTHELNMLEFIFLKLKNWFDLSIKVFNLIFKKQKTIKDIIDAVDVYNIKIWAERFEDFIDFKFNGPTSIGVDIQIHSSKDIYGFSEKTCSLNLDSFEEPYRFYNVDTFKYKLNVTDAMYGSTPLLITLNDFDENLDIHKVIYSSIFWVNPSDTYVKIKKNNELDNEKYVDSWWVSETGILDLIILVSQDIEEIYYLMNIITGFPLFAPRFSLGFHYSKWEDTDEKRVSDIQNFLEEFKVPYDSIWLDIEHTNKKGYFTWDKKKFPNIDKMISDLNSKGKHIVIIADPHFRVDNKYYVYSFFEKLKRCDTKFKSMSLNYKYMTKYVFNQLVLPKKFFNINCKFHKTNKIYLRRIIYSSFKSPWVQVPFIDKPQDFIGECWPGPSKYLDLFSPIIQTYFSNYFEKLFKNHLNVGYWIDMNEPAVFNAPELTFPKQVIYQKGFEDREVHSLYSFYHAKSVFSGLINKFYGSRRPFILSRSFWFGSSRYSLIWTGDTESNWKYYYSTIKTNIRNALCGFSLTGSDIGGYEGYPEDLLFIRWHQIGIWFPLYRQHGSINSINKDYIFKNPKVASIVTKYIRLRYSLIPFWYTILAFYVFYGKPMIKPLFWLNPKNKEIRSIDDSFLVGDSFLISQVSRSNYTLSRFIPYLGNFKYKTYFCNFEKSKNQENYNIWYNLYLNYVYIDNNIQYFDSRNANYTPDLVKGGSIIPFSSNINIYTSKDQLKYPTNLVVYLTGKISTSFKFKNQILNINKNFSSNSYYYYNDFIIDPITIHSEGNIFLDDGETYSFLNDEYIFDDIIFKTTIKKGLYQKHSPALNFLDDNLFSALNLDFQKEKLINFKNYFEYVLYLNPRHINIKSSHIPFQFKRKNLKEFKNINDSKNSFKLINKKIKVIKIRGLLIKPKRVFAIIKRNVLNSENEEINLFYNVSNLNFTNINNSNLYNIDINIDSDLISFGDYRWEIKINF